MTDAAERIFVGLGGNEGDVLRTFRWALDAMEKLGIEVVAVSRAYRSLAVMADPSDDPDPDYWNAVCELRSTLEPEPLLGVLKGLEQEAGRIERKRWAPRPLDLDILLYGDRVVDEPNLSVPHPRMSERPFVLGPLLELAPDFEIPTERTTVVDLVSMLPDPEEGIEYILGGWR